MRGGRLWLGALLLTGCGDDGGSSGDSSTTMATETSTTMMSADSTSAPPTTTSVGSSSGPSDTSTTDDSGPVDSSGTDSTGAPPERGCPDGPFADTPLPSPMVTATAVPDSSSNAHAGGLAEGPVWLDGSLYLSHFAGGPTPPGTILRYDPGMPVVPAIDNAGSNGLATDGEGNILGASHDDGSISRFTLDGMRTTIVGDYFGARFNSPNDLTVRSDGTIYFTDPSYQAPNPQPQPVTGVYRVDPAGVPELVDDMLNQPNGISLSPDETQLYVGHPGGVMRYDVNPDGTVATPGMPFGTGLSGVDGMGMDCAGNLYVTMFGAGEVDVVAPDGTTLGTIVVAPSLTNVAFGGEDMTTLYATAGNPENGDALYEIELQIPGYPY